MEERVGGRYRCKYCKIWVADNKAQRVQHEGGLRHLSAREAALRDIGRENNERKREREKTFREAVKAGAQRVVQSDQKQFQVWRSRIRDETHVSAMELAEKRKSEIMQSKVTENDVNTAADQTCEEQKGTEGVIGQWVPVTPEEEILPSDNDATDEPGHNDTKTDEEARQDHDEDEAIQDNAQTQRMSKQTAKFLSNGSRAKKRKYRKKEETL